LPPLQEVLLQQVDATSWFSTSQHSRSCDNAGNSSGSSGSRSNQAMVFGLSNMPQWLQQLAQQLPLQQHWPAEVSYIQLHLA
jgi:hypothetical protein